MAKIPIILEPGRADGKLATSDAIFDENKGMFQSELNDIQDTLNSDNPNKPLSAKQGKILKELLDSKVIEAGSVPIDTEPTEGNITHIVNSDGLAKEFNKCNTTIINTDRIANEAIIHSKLSVDIQNLIINLSKTTTFAGIATPTTNPGTPDGPVFYIANGKGTYTNFGGIDVTDDEVVILYYDTSWHKETTGIASNDKLTELEGKTSEIGKEVIGTDEEGIVIEDNNGNVVAEITPDSSTFHNLKSNGKDVLTEHQDISNLATKEDLDGIEHESVAEEEEEAVFEEEDGNFCARVNHRGVDSVGYALNGNPITRTYEPSNQCKGLTHYYHEGGDTIQYTYDFTEDSYIIHNPNGVNGNIYAEIEGLKAGKTYRIVGIGSGITSTKRICASNVVSGLNNTIAELEDNGEGIYSAEFTVLENTITTINIAPRYNSKLTSFTNIKVVEVSDVERSVFVNNFVDNISLEELSDDLKKQLSIDENPTTYYGRSACVFNNVLFIGDSLTEGAFNKKGTNGMSDASGSFYRQEYSYPSFFKKLTGANGENWGLGGHTTKEWWDVRTTEGHPSYKPDDQWKGFDCAIIALGTNDAFRLSSASDTTTALNNIINKVLTLNQRISVFVATPFGGRFALDSKFTEVSETIRGVVNGRTDCYLLDINRYGHMNDKRGYNAGHFTAIGYERLAEDIINYMSWIIDSNDWDFRHIQFSNTNYEPFN